MDALQELPPVCKQRAGIESARAEIFQNKVRLPDAVSSHDFAIGPVPDKQMLIIGIELIQVYGLAGSFTDSTKRRFPQTPDFTHHVRQLIGAGTINNVL